MQCSPCTQDMPSPQDEADNVDKEAMLKILLTVDKQKAGALLFGAAFTKLGIMGIVKFMSEYPLMCPDTTESAPKIADVKALLQQFVTDSEGWKDQADAKGLVQDKCARDRP